MRQICFSRDIDTLRRRLPFFLATEEWAARSLPADEYFFSWQVDPTVICGRNQDIAKEVNLDYCTAHGIDVVRRRSGGGAVMADRDNFMFSYITYGDDVVEKFAHYTSMIAGALCELGLDAEATGRNDILVGGKKIAGNAFYHIPGRCIAHGTMLYNYDAGHIANALTPSRGKLESKGVKSVPARITCLKSEGITLTPEEFQQFILQTITDEKPYVITQKDLEEIQSIERHYYEPTFLKISGHESSGDGSSRKRVAKQCRIEGSGEFCAEYELDADNRIHDFHLSGDFFMSEDVDTLICSHFNGVEHTPEQISALIAQMPWQIIPGMKPEHLGKLFF